MEPVSTVVFLTCVAIPVLTSWLMGKGTLPKLTAAQKQAVVDSMTEKQLGAALAKRQKANPPAEAEDQAIATGIATGEEGKSKQSQNTPPPITLARRLAGQTSQSAQSGWWEEAGNSQLLTPIAIALKHNDNSLWRRQDVFHVCYRRSSGHQL